MANSISRHRPFPALFIICILAAGCSYLFQANQNQFNTWLPGVAGIANLDPSLIIMDISVRLPMTIDLILLPAFFILIYAMVILLYPFRTGIPRWRELRHRLSALFSSLIIILCCIASGGLLSWLLQGHLPGTVQKGMESLGMNADIGLPFAAYKSVHLHGNIIPLICMTIGVLIAIGKINRAPAITRPTRLTREQKMTPYKRMLRERSAIATPSRPAQPKPALNHTAAATHSRPIAAARPATTNTHLRPACYPEPRPSLQPEAVNYRPLW
jgi:hypothetical protein